MNPFHKFAAISFAALSFTSFDAYAAPDINAAVVQLRHPDMGGCVVEGASLQNCFTTISSFNTWLATRSPSATKPLIVEISPGTFSGTLQCTNGGHTTYRGSGQKNTKITSATQFLIVANCTNLAFSEMSFESTCSGFCSNFYAAEWQGGGNSVWNNVEMVARHPWGEVTGGSCNVTKGKHYWFGSRLIGIGNASIQAITYTARCDESWFYGSEISVEVVGNNLFVHALRAQLQSEIHVYGGAIRAIAGPGVNIGLDPGAAPQGMIAATATGDSVIHIHGTGIDVISSEGNSVAALSASGNGMIHATGVGYFLQTGPGGTVTRILTDGTGHVHAPYLWEHVPDPDGNPATTADFTSANGMDQTTITANTSDGHPHTSVYSSTCPANARWYDTTDKVCRSQ